MRDLQKDMEWLTKGQYRIDLSDVYLRERGQSTRADYEGRTPEYEYGISFVESSIAREWLERAIRAENVEKAAPDMLEALKELAKYIQFNKGNAAPIYEKAMEAINKAEGK